jgi:hypothetical protein
MMPPVVVTPMFVVTRCPLLSAKVAAQVPAATPVTVKVKLGPLPLLGATVAIVPPLGLQVSLSVKAPV